MVWVEIMDVRLRERSCPYRQQLHAIFTHRLWRSQPAVTRFSDSDGEVIVPMYDWASFFAPLSQRSRWPTTSRYAPACQAWSSPRTIATPMRKSTRSSRMGYKLTRTPHNWAARSLSPAAVVPLWQNSRVLPCRWPRCHLSGAILTKTNQSPPNSRATSSQQPYLSDLFSSCQEVQTLWPMWWRWPQQEELYSGVWSQLNNSLIPLKVVEQLCDNL